MSGPNERWPVASSLCLLLLASACFRTTAPKGWLPTVAEAQREAFGGWIKVEYMTGIAKRTVEGELIAATPDSVHVLTRDSIVALATGSLSSGTLTTFDMQLRTLRVWTLVGAVAAVSHGFVLVLSAPAWIIAGSTATAVASRAPRVESTSPALLRAYARFPQGIPPVVDPRSLRQKDVRVLSRR
jgi:hypothetical protein